MKTGALYNRVCRKRPNSLPKGLELPEKRLGIETSKYST